MRHLKWFGGFLAAIFLANGMIAIAQDTKECKVLQAELSGEYKGECKKGLAHGIGEATGTDRYTGSFKKGYPNGKGIYYYSSGAVYEGSFLNGKRHGQGKLSFSNEGELITEEGLWEKDNYIGKKPEPAYEITLKRNVSRYTFIKTSDPRNMVMIKIIRNGNTIYPDNLLLSGSTGSIVQQKPFTGFEQLQYPFHGSIKYSILNPFNNTYVDYEFNFTLREPGSWEITLSH
jgi:hypothetical protein